MWYYFKGFFVAPNFGEFGCWNNRLEGDGFGLFFRSFRNFLIYLFSLYHYFLKYNNKWENKSNEEINFCSLSYLFKWSTLWGFFVTITKDINHHNVIQFRVILCVITRVHTSYGFVGCRLFIRRFRNNPSCFLGIRITVIYFRDIQGPSDFFVSWKIRRELLLNTLTQPKRLTLPCLTELRNGIFFFLP